MVYLQGPSWTPVRVNITGEKPPETLSQDSGLGWVASPYLSRRKANGVSRRSHSYGRDPRVSFCVYPNQLNIIPFDGGASLYRFDWPALVGGDPRWSALDGEPRWAPGGEAVDYVLTRNGVSNIWRQKLSGGPPKQITNFEWGQIFNFAWSHDGRQLALTRGCESSDVIMISNFR